MAEATGGPARPVRGSTVSKEIIQLLEGIQSSGMIDRGDRSFLEQLLKTLQPLRSIPAIIPDHEEKEAAAAARTEQQHAAALSDDLDNDYAGFDEDLYESEHGMRLDAHMLANDDVLRDTQLATSRRMLKMQKEYEHLVRFVSKLPRQKGLLGWTHDRADLDRVEELFELRPSKHAPGTIGVFAKVDIPSGTKLQYTGFVMDSDTRNEMLKEFVSTTVFEFPKKKPAAPGPSAPKRNSAAAPAAVPSAFEGLYLVGNPMRIGLQINHIDDENRANIDIERNKRANITGAGPVYSDVVSFVVPEREKDSGIDRDEELLTYYSDDFFKKKNPPSCDRCRLRAGNIATTKMCSKQGCENTRHNVCFLKLAGEKPPEGDEPFTCDDHLDRSYHFHFHRHMQRLREEKRKVVPKARNTRSGPADPSALPMHWLPLSGN